MLFAKTLRRSSRLDRSKRNSFHSSNLIENLEQRRLLVGQVQAVVRGDNLFITGEQSANQIEISFHEGNVAVRPKNGTRINGQRGQFVAFTNTDTVPGSIFINLKKGDDTVILASGLKVAKDVKVNGKDGADTLGLNSTIIRDDLIFLGGTGDDRVSVEDSRVVDNVRLKLSDGADLVRLVDSEFRSHVRVRGAEGADSVVVDDIDVTKNLELITHRGDDLVDVQNARVDGSLRIKTRRDDDSVLVDDSTIEGKAFVNLGRDNDNLALGDGDADGDDGTPASGNVFKSDFIGVGRSGIDNLEVDIDNEFRRRRQEGNFEGAEFPDGDTDGAISDADALADDIRTLIDVELTARVETGSDVITEGDGDDRVFVTSSDTVTVVGRADASASLEIDTDGDGTFDDASAVADFEGLFEVDIPVEAGTQTITVRNADQTGETQDIEIRRATFVRMTTPLGDIDIELLDGDAPVTVENFLGYFDRYGDNTIIHRSPDDFVIQGGGFTATDGVVSSIVTDAPIDGEFDSANSNVPATLSMALSGDPDSGTSQWFINIGDNSFLDANGHTVFGNLIGGEEGSSFAVAQAINELPLFDVPPVPQIDANAEVPLRDFDATTELDGTVDIGVGSTTLTGTGTQFLTDLEVGNEITVGTDVFTISAITSDTELTVSSGALQPADDATLAINNTPDQENFILFSSIELIEAIADL